MSASVDNGGLIVCETTFVYPDGSRQNVSSREGFRRLRASNAPIYNDVEGGPGTRRVPSAISRRNQYENLQSRNIVSAPQVSILYLQQS